MPEGQGCSTRNTVCKVVWLQCHSTQGGAWGQGLYWALCTRGTYDVKERWCKVRTDHPSWQNGIRKLCLENIILGAEKGEKEGVAKELKPWLLAHQQVHSPAPWTERWGGSCLLPSTLLLSTCWCCPWNKAAGNCCQPIPCCRKQ